MEPTRESAARLEHDLSTRLSQYHPRQHRGYLAVNALMLLWEDDDLNCIQEVKQFSTLLDKKFRFNVRQFLIPSSRPQDALNKAVGEFLYSFGTHDCLIVVYYAGHGDPDLDGDREAIWAARKKGGSTLKWHLIQPALEAAECDVLIILDCCFAGQAARQPSYHKVELLAAAAMGLRTPGVSQQVPSFTQVLMTEMARIVDESGSVKVANLHRQMLKKQHKLQQQPIYVSLSDDESTSIVITPQLDNILTKESANSQAEAPASLLLQVSLFEPPTSTQKDQIVNWMTTESPNSISAVWVKKVILKAQNTRTLGEQLIQTRTGIQDSQAVFPIGAAPDLRRSLMLLSSTMEKPELAYQLDQEYSIRMTEERCEDIMYRIEDCMTTLDVSTMEDLVRKDEAEETGLSAKLALRLRLLDNTAPPDSSNYSRVNFSTPAIAKERFRQGFQGNIHVIVEYWYYTSEKVTSTTAPASVLLQIRKVATLHAIPKDEGFCSLLGRGYTHEYLHGERLGLIHQIPEDCVGLSHFLLSECFAFQPMVALEIRLRLAQKVSAAIVHYHSIGWLHKGLRSDSVVIFGKKALEMSTKDREGEGPPPHLKLAKPYIFGFDCSRPHEAESSLETDFSHERNIYRHPDRWGRPVPFQKKHDVYSLGVLMLEIALWRPIWSLDPEKKQFSKISDPERLREIYLDICKGRLIHAAGSQYARAAEICFARDLGDDIEDWQFHKFLRENVIGRIVMCVRGLG